MVLGSDYHVHMYNVVPLGFLVLLLLLLLLQTVQDHMWDDVTLFFLSCLFLDVAEERPKDARSLEQGSWFSSSDSSHTTIGCQRHCRVVVICLDR